MSTTLLLMSRPFGCQEEIQFQLAWRKCVMEGEGESKRERGREGGRVTNVARSEMLKYRTLK